MPEVVHTHAMTTKQAKAAYKKAGGPRFTEKELRQQKRAAELWDREQRIKEREKTRKENKLKRMKKEEKEREARRKAGLPEVKEGYISPRQCRLGMFFGKDKEEDLERESKGNTTEMDGEDLERKTGDNTAERNEEDLERESRGNTTERNEEDLERKRRGNTTERDEVDLERGSREEATEKEGEDRDQPNDGNSTAETVEFDWPPTMPEDNVRKTIALQQTTPPRPSKTLPTAEKLSKIYGSGVSLGDEDWLALLPSNTQVEREISSSPPRSQPPVGPPPAGPPPTASASFLSPPKSQRFSKSPRTKPASSQHLAAVVPQAAVEATMALISTQDFEDTMEEMEDMTTPAKLQEPFISTQDFKKMMEEMEQLTTPVKLQEPSADFFDLGNFGMSTQEFFNFVD
ncbi:hypothetical protein MMC30_004102 [Trapelia coarctata]|nr:hypothetical protein [Trapelia coarctata]